MTEPALPTARSPRRGVVPLKLQYFFSFATLGSLLPYAPLFLQDRGLSLTQVGFVMAAGWFALFVTPVLTTALADTHVSAARLLGVANLIGCAAIAALIAAQGFWPLLFCFGAIQFAAIPILPLQDGLYFQDVERRKRDGHLIPDYHHVRLWGTYGFIAPSIVLYALLAQGYPIDVAMWVGIACCLLGAINSLALPTAGALPDSASALTANRRTGMPTFAALAALWNVRGGSFVAALFLAQLAAAIHYNFFPMYLTDEVGFDQKWVGLIINLGVTVEILYMLGFAWFAHRIGFKGVLIAGLGLQAVRMVVLAAFPAYSVAVASEALHGMWVLAIHVAPAMVLNRLAGPDFRASIQGLYTMLVYGSGRVVGSLAAGYLADWNLRGAYLCGAGVLACAVLLLAVAFSEPPNEPTETPSP